MTQETNYGSRIDYVLCSSRLLQSPHKFKPATSAALVSDDTARASKKSRKALVALLEADILPDVRWESPCEPLCLYLCNAWLIVAYTAGLLSHCWHKVQGSDHCPTFCTVQLPDHQKVSCLRLVWLSTRSGSSCFATCNSFCSLAWVFM